MHHMVKCMDNNMPLPYAMLISRFMIACEINLFLESCMNLGWCPFFEKKKINEKVKYPLGTWCVTTWKE